MNLSLVRNVLLRIDKMKAGESILIDDLNKEFPNINSDDFLTLIMKLASRYYVRIDSRYAFDCYKGFFKNKSYNFLISIWSYN